MRHFEVRLVVAKVGTIQHAVKARDAEEAEARCRRAYAKNAVLTVHVRERLRRDK